jgi:hypothetical protein
MCVSFQNDDEQIIHNRIADLTRLSLSKMGNPQYQSLPWMLLARLRQSCVHYMVAYHGEYIQIFKYFHF